jgi:hypothetical protein
VFLPSGCLSENLTERSCQLGDQRQGEAHNEPSPCIARAGFALCCIPNLWNNMPSAGAPTTVAGLGQLDIALPSIIFHPQLMFEGWVLALTGGKRISSERYLTASCPCIECLMHNDSDSDEQSSAHMTLISDCPAFCSALFFAHAVLNYFRTLRHGVITLFPK